MVLISYWWSVRPGSPVKFNDSNALNRHIDSSKSTLKNIASQIDEDVYEKNIKKNFGELFSNRLIMQLIRLKWLLNITILIN